MFRGSDLGHTGARVYNRIPEQTYTHTYTPLNAIERVPKSARTTHWIRSLVRKKSTHLQKAISESSRKRFPASVSPRWVLCREEAEVGVGLDSLLGLRQVKLSVVVQKPVQRFQNLETAVKVASINMSLLNGLQLQAGERPGGYEHIHQISRGRQKKQIRR